MRCDVFGRGVCLIVAAWMAGCAPLLPQPPGAAVLAGAAASTPGAPSQARAVVKILALNDLHGQLESPGNFRASASAPPVPVGGVDALAGAIAAARAAHPHTVVVSAGDLIGASPLISALFHDEPTIEAMNRAGLDFNAVGNHEFDDGADELQRMQRGGCHPSDRGHSCRGADVGTPVPFEGARFGFLAANVIEEGSGRTIFPAYGIRQFALAGGRSVSVAFIGMTLQGTARIVSPSGIRGLGFRDEAATVNALVPVLRAQGANAVVVLIHQGGAQAAPAPVDINGCAGELAGSPIKAIVGRLDDAVDLVVSGHTHAAYNCRLPLASGRKIPVTSANTQGRVLTEIDLTIDAATGDVTAATAINKLVERIAPAGKLAPAVEAAANVVGGYRALAAPLAQRVIGGIARDLPFTRDAACNMPAGELIADSQLAATAAPEAGGAQLALMNPGGVRSPGFSFASSAAGEGDGRLTYGEAFTVQPFGNSLVTMTLSTQQLRNLLEQQFPGCRGQVAYARVLLPSRGLRYAWDARQACGHRVRSVVLTTGGASHTLVDAEGRVQQPDRPWRVAVNSYLADGGDGFTALAAGTDRVGGGQDIDALVAYMAGFLPPKPPYDPAGAAGGESRIRRLDAGTACP